MFKGRGLVMKSKRIGIALLALVVGVGMLSISSFAVEYTTSEAVEVQWQSVLGTSYQTQALRAL